jgi:hypothetical protein
MAAMQTAPLSRPEEVTMFTRRIVACVCALALAVPAAAGARAGFDPPPTTHHTVYGDTTYDLQNQQDLGTPKFAASKGDTKNDITPSSADRTASLSPAQLAAAYGTAQPKGTPVAPAISKRHVVVPAGKAGGRAVVLEHHATSGAGSSGDDLDGWQIAAVAEAGLLAALALGAAAFVGRSRPRRTATA